jgi:type III secretion system YscD/HrpQ family protein
MILRVLNAPHAGAEAEIGAEPISIGSGADCDLIFSDPLLQPEHCKIRLEAGQIEVELTGGAAHLNGARVEKSPFSITPGQVLSIGSTHIAFGAANEPWGQVVIPEIREVGGTAPELETQPSAPVAEAPETEPAESADALRVKRIKWGIAGSAVLVLFLMTAFFFYGAEQRRSMTSIMRQGDDAGFDNESYTAPSAKNQALAAKLCTLVQQKLPEAKASVILRSGRPLIRIYVRSSEQANMAQRIVNDFNSPIFCEVVALEEIETSAEMMASMMGFAIDVTFEMDGTLYWNGYIPTQSDWRSLEQKIEKDLPLVKENVPKFVYAKQIKDELGKLLSDSKIPQSVSMNAQPREIIFYGSIPENLSEVWSNVFKAMRGKFSNMVTLSDDVGSGKAVVVKENPFPSEIVGVTLGALPSVVLLDGQRIYIGAILGDGSVLTEISETQLILTGPHGKRKIPLELGS